MRSWHFINRFTTRYPTPLHPDLCLPNQSSHQAMSSSEQFPIAPEQLVPETLVKYILMEIRVMLYCSQRCPTHHCSLHSASINLKPMETLSPGDQVDTRAHRSFISPQSAFWTNGNSLFPLLITVLIATQKVITNRYWSGH